MPYVTTRDGVELYYKDWGSGPPVILIHGWPLNANSLDRLAMKVTDAGYRTINYDRRGLGRSGQPWGNYEWDNLADDLADVMEATGATEDVTVIGYSMGGGEAARYMSRYEGKGIARIGLYASVVPGVLQSEDNPHGNPASGFDDIAAGIEQDVAAFFRHTFLPPFYGVGGTHTASNDVIEGAVDDALDAGMKGLIAMAHDFSFGDFTGDIDAIDVPTLILHGTEDVPLPIDATARRANDLIPQAQLIEYEGHPHGFYATNSDQMIADTLAFLGANRPPEERTPPMPSVAEQLVTTLADIGVRQIFGVVGDALNPLSEAIRAQDRIEWVGVHHEEGAALAAAGQAKLTGKLAVCAGTTGPGANHLVAGLYEAKRDHAPVLAISGWVPAELRGIDYRQENAPNLLFRDVAAYTETITDPVMAPQLIHQAIAVAYGERGVAHLNIPQDVIAGEVSAPTPSVDVLRPRPEVAPAAEDLDRMVELIEEAGTVAVFCGTGCRGSEEELLALSDLLRAPLLHTFRGQDMIDYADPRWMGGVGMIGGQPGVDAVNSADLLLMLGTDYPYKEWLPTHGNVIQVDERAHVLGRRAVTKLGVVGSVKPALQALLERLEQRGDATFFDKVTADRGRWNDMLDDLADPARTPGTIHPQAVARAVSDRAADDAIFATDTGLATLWAANWTRPNGRQRCVGTFNNQSVGTALGMGVGAQALDRSRQVIVHVGDGGFLMLLGEFMTAVGHGLPIKVVVYDNSGWGLVHMEMEQIGNPIAPGANLRNPDWAALAAACGAQGFSVSDPGKLGDTIDEFLAVDGPAILAAVVAKDERPVMPKPDPAKEAQMALAKSRERFTEEPPNT